MKGEGACLILGGAQPGNVAWSLERGATLHGPSAHLLDAAAASRAPRLVQAVNWHLRGHRPPRLERFGEELAETCLRLQARILITTGQAPVSGDWLSRVRSMGIVTVNYSTDDPWNPAHRAPWFIDALPHYRIVFTPRWANVDDFKQVGVERVEYLRFGYDPGLHRPERQEGHPVASDGGFDVLFVGGADEDRVPIIAALRAANLKVGLYGSYWERFKATRGLGLGQADPESIRWATADAKVCLCLVRRANRDGHVMRSYEIAAIGGCALAEDTEDHRAIFGREGEGALYFASTTEMVDKARWLIAHPAERARIARNARARVTGAPNTYGDRLKTMLKVAKEVCG